MKTKLLTTSDQTEQAGFELAQQLTAPTIIFLEGQLGAGKTTFVRGLMRGFGYTGTVKSPTFTLIETYLLPNKEILHADLYRLKDASELDAMGFRDYFTDNSIVLIEWASHAENVLPKPTLRCTLSIPENGEGRLLEIVNF